MAPPLRCRSKEAGVEREEREGRGRGGAGGHLDVASPPVQLRGPRIVPLQPRGHQRRHGARRGQWQGLRGEAVVRGGGEVGGGG